VTKTQKAQFVPAIIFWQWGKSISATLPERHQAEKIQSYMAHYADSLNLASKLNGQSLKISINKAPANFTYANRGYFVYLFIAYAMGVQEVIKPEFSDLKLTYTLIKNNEVSKTGELTVLDRNEQAGNKMRSTKKFTRNYIEKYEANTRLMSLDGIKKLMKEIETVNTQNL
jgi:hypothetical protein